MRGNKDVKGEENVGDLSLEMKLDINLSKIRACESIYPARPSSPHGQFGALVKHTSRLEWNKLVSN